MLKTERRMPKFFLFIFRLDLRLCESEINSEKQNREKQSRVFYPEQNKILIARIPAEIITDKRFRIRRASDRRPGEFGNGNERNADAERNPFAPIFGFQNQNRNAENKQNRQTMQMNERQSSGEKSDDKRRGDGVTRRRGNVL